MAGAVGRVLNKSSFSSFIVKEWAAWMTEAVILHASGMSIPELRHKFNRTDTHIRNILNTDQAKEIVRKLQSQSLKAVYEDAPAKITAIRDKALSNMSELLEDETGVLKKASPFAFLEASRKVYETLSKHDTPAAPAVSVTQNIQQNILNSVPSELLERLRSGPSLSLGSVPENVEYLGSPPTREIPVPILSAGIGGTPSQGEKRLALVVSNNPAAADG
jgi:hypothetical protein